MFISEGLLVTDSMLPISLPCFNRFLKELQVAPVDL